MTNPMCPCGSQLQYVECCGRFHDGHAKPATAEALMRSRYAAFVRHRTDYLMNTLHPGRHRPDERMALEQSFRDTQWEGLVILQHTLGQPGDNSGTVEFIARYRSAGVSGQLHENSRFVKEGEQWLYVDGDMLQAPAPGRNDPCWCGSGKKFKKCHG